MPESSRKRLEICSLARWQDSVEIKNRSEADHQTLLISRLQDIPNRLAEWPSTGSVSKHLLFIEDLPVEAISSRLIALKVRSDHKIHLARETSEASISELLFRVLAGIVRDDANETIADAWIETDDLVLLSPTFERLRIPLALLEQFIGTQREQIKQFEIDEDGSFLYWPHAGAHFGWNQFLNLIDPLSALSAHQKTAAFNDRYGRAIRAVREETGLIQKEIAGLTDRNLRRIEKGNLAASRNSLTALAKAHHLELNDYLNELASRIKND